MKLSGAKTNQWNFQSTGNAVRAETARSSERKSVNDV